MHIAIELLMRFQPKRRALRLIAVVLVFSLGFGKGEAFEGQSRAFSGTIQVSSRLIRRFSLLTQDENKSPVDRVGGEGVGITMPELESRIWTDNQQRTVRGSFVGLVDQDKVRIKQVSGIIDVSLKNLSEPDQEYVREILRRFDPRVHGRTWNMRAGRIIEGSYIQIKSTQIWILTSFEDDRLEIDTRLFSDPDIQFVIDLLNKRVTLPPMIQGEKFRLWLGPNTSWAMIGRLKDFDGETLVLEQEDQDVYVTYVALSSADQAYVRERFPEFERRQRPSRNSDRRRDAGRGQTTSENSAGSDFFARYYVIHPLFILVLVAAVMALLCAVSWKFIRESFLPDDDD